MNSLIRSFAVACIALAASTTPGIAQDISSDEFDAEVLRVIRENPEVILNAVNHHVAEQQEAEARARDEAFLSLAPEFMAVEGLPELGNPEGDVEILYVLDAACAYCRSMTQILQDLLAEDPDIRIRQVWVNFLTPASEYAARLAFLIHERFPESYAEFYHTLLSRTGQLTDVMVDEVVGEVLGEQALAVLRIEAVDGETGMRVGGLVNRNLQMTQIGGIDGTPFFYVEGADRVGVMRGAVPIQNLRAAIAAARAGQ